MAEPPRSVALRARLAVLQSELHALRSRPSTPASSPPSTWPALEAECAALRGANTTLSAEVRALSARVEMQREQVSATQQAHDTAMQQGLEELRDLELAMKTQRDRNAALKRGLESAQEALRRKSDTARATPAQSASATEARQEADGHEKEAPLRTAEEGATTAPTAATRTASQTGGGGGGGGRPGGRRNMRAPGTAAAELRATMGDAAADLVLLRYASLHFEAKLGTGVSSTVYRGTYDKTRVVAIKVLKGERAQKDLKDFRKELSILKQVHSPHVVEFIGATLEPKLCIVMELCPHGTLFHALSATPAPRDAQHAPLLTWARVLVWCAQIAAGMATLHAWEPQIVHRDLKPLNLLLDADYAMKICDFGLSRYTNPDQASDEMQTLTKLRGTYAYTAPEIYHKAQYSAKSDIYSIGVICWEMGTRLVTGAYQRPYAEYAELKYDYQIIYQTATQQLRPTFAPPFPGKFKQIVQACWTQEPERRPSAKQLLEGLDFARADFDKNDKRWPAL